jgi:NAD+ synthase (glutamine-hydrolysing)
MRLALIQLNPVVGDLARNRAKIRAAVQALPVDIQLGVTPELSLVGYPPRDLLLAPEFIRRAWEEVQALAEDLATAPPVLVGLPEINPHAIGRPLFNSAVLLMGGRIVQTIRKSLLPTYDVFDEDRYFEPFTGESIIELAGKRLGISICEDIWNDRDYWVHPRYHRDPVEQMAAAGVDLIINLSASPYSYGKQANRETMLAQLATKHQVPVVYVNQVGGNDDLIFDGYSCLVSAQGQVVARAAGFVSEILVIDETGGTLAPLLAQEAELWAALVLGVRDYTQKCGFTKMLLGLSGGIDSAVTAAIACAALGAEHVLGVLLPSPYSSHDSITDSLALAQTLGMETMTIPITPAMQTYDVMLTKAFEGYGEDVTEENIQSRIRGMILMALSNKYGSLLLTTGNKSELAVGYCTLYGDMCGGLAVIADVPKTQVYRLAQWCNRHETVIPTAILTKPPSAELRPEQRDDDSLPPYDLLDAILALHIEQHQGANDIIAAGYPAATVHRVLHLVKRAEFKRRQTAPGLKVTDRAFGTGWRMPIARG